MSDSRQKGTTLGTCAPDQVYQVLQTSPQGLNSQEVKKRQATYGPNQLKESKKEPIWLTFVKHFTSLMALLLWVGGFIAVISHSLELGIAIWLVNIINGLFSFIQEYKASQATAALNKLLPSYTRVLRDGKEDKILAQDLVPGDLVFIEEGDRISADGRLVAVTDLQVNQSALTGESNPIYKSDQADLTPDKTEGFTIDKEKSTIQLLGENIIKLTKSYTFKDDVFTVDISGMKHDYYKKDSKAYQEALKKYGYQ